MNVTIFPRRIWEPIGTDEEGRTLWSSRPVDNKDRQRRSDIAQELGATQLEADEIASNYRPGERKIRTRNRVEIILARLSDREKEKLLSDFQEQMGGYRE